MGKKGKRKKGHTAEVAAAGPEYYPIGEQRVYGATSRRDAKDILTRVNETRKEYYEAAGI